MKKILIVANGPFLTTTLIQAYAANSIIIALDGAAQRLIAIDIKPDIILGDFDSITEPSHHVSVDIDIPALRNPKHYKEKYGISVVYQPCQDFTDLQKAILYCDAKPQWINTAIHIICALDGLRLDHHEMAVRTLKWAFKLTRAIYLHSHTQTIEFVKDNTITISGFINDKCAIFAAPKCRFYSPNQGLAWSRRADDMPFELAYGITESTSNYLIKTKADICIQGQALVIYPAIVQYR